MRSVLFIAPADLGEAVLASGALAYAARDGDATIVCAPEAGDLFRAFPRLAALHPLEGGAQAWTSAWLKLAGQHFELVMDGGQTWLGRMVRRRRRLALAPGPMLRHRVEQWSELLGADGLLAPRVWLDEPARRAAAGLDARAALLALAPGGSMASKCWPAERFAATARRLLGGALAGGRVVLLGVQRDQALLEDIAFSLAADGVPTSPIEHLDLLASAAVLERATLCIGNDNVLTHLAAAVDTPTLALFGPTDERVRAPYGTRVRTLRGREYEAIMGLPAVEGASLMEDISVDAVEAAAQDLLRAGGLL